MTRLACLVAAVATISSAALAHTPQQPPHQLFNEGALKLESGQAIEDFAISYVTHGTLNAAKSNVILMVTAVSGNHHRLDFMIGPGKALDTDSYFINRYCDCTMSRMVNLGNAMRGCVFELLGDVVRPFEIASVQTMK